MLLSRLLKVAAFGLLLACPLQAGVLSSAITINGIRDNLNDRSFSILIDVDGDGAYSVNDVLYGYLRVDTVNNDVETTSAGTSVAATGTASTPQGELGILYSAQITSVDDGGLPGTLGDTFSLSATSSASDFSLLNILDPSLAAELTPQLSNLDETIFVAVSSTTTPFTIGGTGLNSVSDFTGADFDLELAAGIAAGSDDYFHLAQSDVFNSYNGVEAGGFTIFDKPGLGSSIFLPVGVDSDFSMGQNISFHDFVLFDGAVSFESLETVSANGTDYDAVVLTNHSNFGINAVPEPTSLAAWGVLLGLGGFTRRRRQTA